MLAKSSKNMYFDAHFHLFYCTPADFCGCTCAHSVEEWITQQKVTEKNKNIKLSYGIHPQAVGKIDIAENMAFMEKLAQQNLLDAIGETGFDFFTDDFKFYAKEQEEVFVQQIELAQKYNLPAVIHCRKANEKLFEYSKALKKLPAVLFHSFMGTPTEAQSLINRGINAYFSFGKQLLNNNKKVIACAKELPLKVLLCETDAPYQTLKDEPQTHPEEITRVYEALYNLRNDISPQDFFTTLENNFNQIFTK